MVCETKLSETQLNEIERCKTTLCKTKRSKHAANHIFFKVSITSRITYFTRFRAVRRIETRSESNLEKPSENGPWQCKGLA